MKPVQIGLKKSFATVVFFIFLLKVKLQVICEYLSLCTVVECVCVGGMLSILVPLLRLTSGTLFRILQVDF